MTDYLAIATQLARQDLQNVRARTVAEGDPVEREIAAEERRDHQLAKPRGERCKRIADNATWELFGRGVIQSGKLREDLAHALAREIASELYPASAVDL